MKTTPQHVKAARQLESYYEANNNEKKIQAGDIIYFVKTKTKEGVKPIQIANPSEIDIDKYKETMESTLDQVLDALGISYDELTGTRTLDFFMR